MNGMLDFELGAESLERSKVDLVVAGFFVDQQPLRGGAGRVDWRLCGLVSEQILAERIHGKRGEAILIPSSGQMRANHVMLVGLGVRSKYKLTGVTKRPISHYPCRTRRWKKKLPISRLTGIFRICG